MKALHPKLILSILLLTLGSCGMALAQSSPAEEPVIEPAQPAATQPASPQEDEPALPASEQGPRIIFLDDSDQQEPSAGQEEPGSTQDQDQEDPVLPLHDLETYGLPASLFDNSHSSPPVGASRGEQQATIEKAIQDLQSDDPEIRRSAVMILGKYRLPDARSALLQAFRDPAAQVRQSALVSILEDQMRLDPVAGIHIANLVDDPDVHIRRLASSALGQTMLRSSVINFPMTPHHGSGAQSLLPENIQQKIIKAFQDPDLTVRRNITAAYSTLRIRLSDDIITSLLNDSDREIRMNMLQGLSDTWQTKLIEHAGLLIDDPDDTIRLELANFFNTYNIPAALPYIRQLAEDEDFNVRQTAQLTLFQIDPSVEALRPLIQQLKDPRTPRDMSTQIVYSIGALQKSDANTLLQQLLDDPDPKYLSEAIQLQAALDPQALQPQTLLKFTEHSSSQIRRSALRALRHLHKDLTDQHYQQLLQNRYPAVRSYVAQLSATLTPERAEPLLISLLLDPEQQVRLNALSEIAAREIPGWEQILEQTLYDPNKEIAQTAILLFSRNPTQHAVDTLQDFARSTDDPSLRNLATTQAQRIQQELRDTFGTPQTTPSRPTSPPQQN